MFGPQIINRDTIVKEGNPSLRIESKDEVFPLSDYKKDIIKNMQTYLKESNIEEIALEKNLEPAVGIAAPQIGINSKICAIYIEDEDGTPVVDLVLINPKVISKSDSLSYLGGGEGCLSIPNKREGYVYRNSEIEVEYYNVEGEKHTLKANDFIAIVIQHEIDHLYGILYFDHINKEEPFKKIDFATEL